MIEVRSYGPDKLLVGFWALLASPPTFTYLYMLLRMPDRVGSIPFWAALCPLLPILFASRFRTTFTSTEFVYRRWAPTVRVRYADIDRIDVTNVTPVATQPIGAFIVTKDGSRLPFWPKLFPREAVKEFFALAKS